MNTIEWILLGLLTLDLILHLSTRHEKKRDKRFDHRKDYWGLI